MANTQEVHQLVEHLFRHESSRIIAILTRIFGAKNMDLAEDVVQNTLIKALEHWTFKGIPDNPSAWIMKVARNNVLGILNHEQYREKYQDEITALLGGNDNLEGALDEYFLNHEVADEQLRMMFMCSHPSLSQDSKVALTLKTVCGFSVKEIARAFLQKEDTIQKRLVRARKEIRETDIPFEVPVGKELGHRLETVLEVIYLLFNEGYSPSEGDAVIKYQLCGEAIRLAHILADHDAIKRKDVVYALLALMYLNASRFKARLNETGHIVEMANQDRQQWDQKLIREGLSYFEKSAADRTVSYYHVLAAISANHCVSPDFESTNWPTILSLYNDLLSFDDSPVVLLNRSVAIYHVYGAEAAIQELEKIQHEPALKNNHLFYSTLAEFKRQNKAFEESLIYYQKALKLAPTAFEKTYLNHKMAEKI